MRKLGCNLAQGYYLGMPEIFIPKESHLKIVGEKTEPIDVDLEASENFEKKWNVPQ